MMIIVNSCDFAFFPMNTYFAVYQTVAKDDTDFIAWQQS